MSTLDMKVHAHCRLIFLTGSLFASHDVILSNVVHYYKNWLNASQEVGQSNIINSKGLAFHFFPVECRLRIFVLLASAIRCANYPALISWLLMRYLRHHRLSRKPVTGSGKRFQRLAVERHHFRLDSPQALFIIFRSLGPSALCATLKLQAVSMVVLCILVKGC